jgi:hypothetical protein
MGWAYKRMVGRKSSSCTGRLSILCRLTPSPQPFPRRGEGGMNIFYLSTHGTRIFGPAIWVCRALKKFFFYQSNFYRKVGESCSRAGWWNWAPV